MALEFNSSEFKDSFCKFYARFESGALTTDSSGNGHTLTAISDPAEDASGAFGGAVALDADDAYSAVDHADFRPTGDFTIGAWVNTAVSSAIKCLFQSYSTTDSSKIAGILLRLNATGKINLFSGRNTGTVSGTDYLQITGVTDCDDNAGHFCVGTWDGSYLRIYVDGKLDKAPLAWANAPGYSATTNYIRVGTQCSTGTNALFVTGSLDEIVLLNGRVLNDEEIAYLYGVGRKRTKTLLGVGA